MQAHPATASGTEAAGAVLNTTPPLRANRVLAEEVEEEVELLPNLGGAVSRILVAVLEQVEIRPSGPAAG